MDVQVNGLTVSISDMVLEDLVRTRLLNEQASSPIPKIGTRWNGGVYAGIVGDVDGDFHLILLDGEFEGDWNAAMEWAKSIDGHLPSRRAQAILYGNLKKEFKDRGYWSSEQHESGSNDAWGQLFSRGGGQGRWGKDYEILARAVRRVHIQ